MTINPITPKFCDVAAKDVLVPCRRDLEEYMDEEGFKDQMRYEMRRSVLDDIMGRNFRMNTIRLDEQHSTNDRKKVKKAITHFGFEEVDSYLSQEEGGKRARCKAYRTNLKGVRITKKKPGKRKGVSFEESVELIEDRQYRASPESCVIWNSVDSPTVGASISLESPSLTRSELVLAAKFGNSILSGGSSRLQKLPRSKFTFRGFEFDKSVWCIRSVPASVIEENIKGWTRVAKKLNWTLNVDSMGDTPWGEAVRDSIASILIFAKPEELSSDTEEVDRLREVLENMESGERSMRIFRRHGRLYHPFTECPKKIRKCIRFKVGDEIRKTVMVDMHATFPTIAISFMPDCEEKEILIPCVQSLGFYKLVGSLLPHEKFEDNYDPEFLREYEEKEGKEYNIKAAVQRELFFWQDNRMMHMATFNAIAKAFPRFANMCLNMHSRLGASAFSKKLCEIESLMFIDRAVPAIRSNGDSVLPIHDGLIVADIYGEEVKELLEDISLDVLGFRAGIKIEG